MKEKTVLDKTNWKSAFIVVLVALAVSLMRIGDFLLPMNRDSGTFAYGGWMMLDGGIPFRDFWDNKPPGIFALNMIAFWLFGPHTWAVVLLQLPFFALSLFALWGILRKYLGHVPSLAALLFYALFASSHALKEEGNFTECYSVPLVILAIWFAERWRKTGNVWQTIIAGLMIGFAALVRQSSIVVVAAVAVWIAWSLWREKSAKAAAKEMIWPICGLVFGAAAALVPVIFIYIRAGVFDELMSAVVVYNRLYFKEAYGSGLQFSLRSLVLSIPKAWPIFTCPILALAMWIARGRKDNLMLPSLWFAADLAAVLMAGRFYHHYYLQILPASAVFFGYIYGNALSGEEGFLRKWPVPATVIAFLALFGMLGMQFRAWNWIIQHRFGNRPKPASERTADYLRENTKPADYVFIWGMNPGIAFMARRKMPTMYIHMFPLGAEGLGREKRIAQLVKDLKKHPPKFIVDESAELPAVAPPLDSPETPPSVNFLFRLDGFDDVKAFVRERYKLGKIIDNKKLFVLVNNPE